MQPMEDPIEGDDQNPLFDQEALKEIIDRATDALRPIGLTVLPQSINAMLDPDSGAMMLSFAAQVRPKAATEVREDMEARKEFNRIQAERHSQMIEAKAEEIRKILRENDDPTDVSGLIEDPETCEVTGEAHKLHPSTGHCLDCGFGLEL